MSPLSGLLSAGAALVGCVAGAALLEESVA